MVKNLSFFKTLLNGHFHFWSHYNSIDLYIFVFFLAELSLEDATSVVRIRIHDLASRNVFPEVFLFSAMEHITQNLLQHYHLFTFGLCYSRQEEVHVHDVLVETSPYDVVTLNEGKQIEQWKMEEELKKQEYDFEQKEKV